MVKINKLALLSVLLPLTSNAFTYPAKAKQQQRSYNNGNVLNSKKQEESNVFFGVNGNVMQKALSATLATCLLWNSAGGFGMDGDHQGLFQPGSVMAKEMASGSGSRVNKDAESLLRYGLPINCKEVRNLQVTIENIKNDIGSKRKGPALEGAKKSKSIIAKQTQKMVNVCRDAAECTTILGQMQLNLEPLEASLKAAQDTQQGSDQERIALDQAYEAQDKLSKQLTALEENMVPEGYVTPVPSDYADLPQLKGRATVEMVLKKGAESESNEFDIEGKLFKEAKMKMIIDGFAAPVTSGNFVELVDNGFYTNMKIQRSDGFVVQTGKPDGKAEGYTGGKPSKAIGAGKNGERLIPTEIFLVGDKGPFYESTVEDEGRGGEATVLPFNSYGAMVRDTFSNYLSDSSSSL